MNTVLEVTTTLQVVSTPPAAAPDERVIEWSRRSTEKTPVAATERYRGVVVKASTLAIAPDACNSRFHSLLQSTVLALAADAFTAWIRDNMHATKMEAARLSVDAVLAFWAEEKQRLSIDGAKITEFLKASATIASFEQSKRETWLSKVPKIAAPAYRNLFTATQAASIVAQIADADLENPACLFIVQRCNNIINAPSTVEELL